MIIFNARLTGKIISINKNISLKEGKIAVNLDEKINQEILRKLNSKYNKNCNMFGKNITYKGLVE